MKLDAVAALFTILRLAIFFCLQSQVKIFTCCNASTFLPIVVVNIVFVVVAVTITAAADDADADDARVRIKRNKNAVQLFFAVKFIILVVAP